MEDTKKTIPLTDDERLMMQSHIIEALQPEFEKYLNICEVVPRLNSLDDEFKERIHEMENSSRRNAVTMLIDMVKEKKIWAEFIEVLRVKGLERYLDVIDDRKVSVEETAANQNLEFLISCLKADIIDFISSPTDLLPDLQQYDILSRDDADAIERLETNSGRLKACIELFRRMPRIKSEWPIFFFKAVKSHNIAILRYLEKDVVRKGESDVVIEQKENDSQTQVAITTGATAEYETEEKGFSDCSESSSSEETFSMRDYQYELSSVAVQGENTIICAPTGSGKTRVALYIIKDHLQGSFGGSKRKVVFLARTNPLVNQQAKSLHFHLANASNSRVLHVTGESDLSLHLHTVLHHYDIFVLTPQILDNHLRDEKIKSLSEFSLIIMDECHHARKGEPYNNLMKKYLKSKKAGEVSLPQIIGLTASLGVEKATTQSEACESIKRLCANLDVFKLSTVVNHKHELERIVPKPDERRRELVANRDDDARRKIHETMINLEEYLEEATDNLADKGLNSLIKKRPSNFDDQSYGQWAVKVKQEAERILNESEIEYARTIYVVSKQLQVYNAALDIHDLVRISDVIQYLTDNLKENREKNIHTDVEAKIAEDFIKLRKQLKLLNLNNKNPNLEILAEELMRLRVEKGPDSLCIIFVRTRATCNALCEWLKSNSNLTLSELKPEPFTGAGVNEELGGMTQNEQAATIARFRNGECKLIVATSVAEEGLDIPECNIVIRYNHVGNEITTVQTRGRSRKLGGTSLLLGYRKVLERELLNMERSKMMESAISQIREMNPNELRKQILLYQKEAIEEEEIREKTKMAMVTSKIDAPFKLRCIICKRLEIKSENIRIVNKSHRVIIDPLFMKNDVRIRPDKTLQKPFDGLQKIGKVHCKLCSNQLGVVFKHNNIEFPAIRISAFQFIAGEVAIFKKWQDVPFQIKELATNDYSEIFRSPESMSNNSDEKDLDETELKYCD